VRAHRDGAPKNDHNNRQSTSDRQFTAEKSRIKPLPANFKRVRELVDQCVDLSVNIADHQTELLRATAPDES
jgi:hypothetical protein